MTEDQFEASSKASISSVLPLPHLCILQRANPRQDYGFKLYIDKKKGPYIGHVEQNSIAHKCGLKLGDHLIAVNDVRVQYSSHKEIIALIASKSLHCRLLVVHEDYADLSDLSVENFSMTQYPVLPRHLELDVVQSSLPTTQSIASVHSEVTTSSKIPYHTPESCFSYPWTSRRTVMCILIFFGLFMSASIIGSMIRRFRKKAEHFTVQWNDVRNDMRHVLNVDLDTPVPVLQLNSPRFDQCVKTMVYFDKKLVVHQVCDIPYCFVSVLNKTRLPDANLLEEAVEKSLMRTRAIYWEENWNYELTLMDTINLVKLNISEAHDCQPIFIRKSVTNFQATSCSNCRKVCIPEYGLVKDTSEITFFSILESACFWIRNSVIPKVYINGFLYH